MRTSSSIYASFLLAATNLVCSTLRHRKSLNSQVIRHVRVDGILSDSPAKRRHSCITDLGLFNLDDEVTFMYETRNMEFVNIFIFGYQDSLLYQKEMKP